jgi:hypothetical protein
MEREKYLRQSSKRSFSKLVGRPSYAEWVGDRGVRCRAISRAIVVLAAILLRAGHAQAVAFAFNDPGWQGTSGLLNMARGKLGVSRVRLVATVDFATLTPFDGLLVLHPMVSLRSDLLVEFMSQGGRVAVIDDFGSSGAFFDRFNIGRLSSPIQPAATLRGNSNLAWAVPSRMDVSAQGESVHEMVTGLQRVLTNHPVTLTNPTLTPVLEIQSTGGAAYVLAYTGLIGQRGRLFAMGDPSVFINLMMRYPDNRLFAERLVSYLVEDDNWGRRGGRLYVVANEFSQYDSSENDLISKRSAKQVLANGRKLVQQGLPEPLAWILGLLAACYIGHRTWWLAVRARRAVLPRFAVPTPILGQPGEAGRAAVLAAVTTPRDLTLLELNSAIESVLTARLGLDRAVGIESMFDAALANNLLDGAQRPELKWFAALVKNAQGALASGRRTRVALADLKRAHRLMLDITSRIDHRQRS